MNSSTTNKNGHVKAPGTPLGGPQAVRVRLLGGFQVSVGLRTIEEGAWRLRKSAALVKLLALSRGHHLHREQVMDLLWPQLGRTAASNNLRGALHAARRALARDPVPASHYLASKEEQIALCPEVELWVDVEAFEEAARTARREREPAAYQAAIDLYAGDLLPEDRYEEWAETRREELRRTYLALLIALAGVYEERGNLGSAIEVLQTVIAEEPTHEEAHVSLMRLYALSGRKEEALWQYERLSEAFSEGLGSEPDATARALREEIVAGKFPQAPTLRVGPSPEEPVGTPRHNLPSPRTSFVGREHELLEVKRALAMTRLLTLTGAGGSGKTRLAMEVARDLVGAYPEGVWLVELARLSEPELVPQAVAAALGVKERPGQSLTLTLVESLRANQTLLVLDNCEHLVKSAAQLVDMLLDSCSRLRMMATSREALRVAGEIVWRVPPLSLPGPQRPSATKELESYESVRLFVERAQQRDPSFALTPSNAQAVVHICRKLGGIPLALELAAARVGALAVAEIASRLEDSLGLLTGGNRTAVARQRTLRDALEWSHDLLSDPEQVMFRRLSVFAGGWTLQAAETVGTGGGVEEGEVLDLLSGLVDKSLVPVEENSATGVRYRLLEPVRQYAKEKLAESGEAGAVRRRHAEYYAALAEEAEPGSRTSSPELLESLEAEHDNFRAVFSWTLEEGEAELGLRLAGALRWFWFERGYLGEGRGWLKQLLQTDVQTAARVKALLAMSWLESEQGNAEEAEEAAVEGLNLAADTEVEGHLLAELRHMLGLALARHGDYERAREQYEEALALSRQAGDKWRVSFHLSFLANVWSDLGNYERATELYEVSLALLQELGDHAHSATVLINLGYIALAKGDAKRAMALSEEAVTLVRKQRHRRFLASALAVLGWATLLQGDHREASALHKESLVLCRALGSSRGIIKRLEELACCAAARAETERAARLCGAAQSLREVVDRGYVSPKHDRLQSLYLESARSQFDAAIWDAAFAEGKAMDLEEAVAYALSEEEPTSPTSRTTEQPSESDPRPVLSRRESEVAALVARGLSNREIAQELHLSERTVHAHVRTILKKLSVPSREQVAARLNQ
jgi:predicted ATPase/DNA-binding SARP family transcriptional activator/DNA-binding CsgD family transcriptional regulator